jgi:hypothetical protein
MVLYDSSPAAVWNAVKNPGTYFHSAGAWQILSAALIHDNTAAPTAVQRFYDTAYL